MNFTIQQLIDRARVQADMDDISFIADSMVVSWANTAVRRLDLKLARSGYVNAPTRTTTVVTGADAYNFPAPLCVVAVHFVSTDGKRLLRIRPTHIGTDYPVLATRKTTSDAPVSWYAEIKPADGTLDIRFSPNPTSGSFIVTTIAERATLVAADTVIYPSGIEEWIVLNLAKRMIMREEGDYRAVSELIKEADVMIDELGMSRQQIDPPEWRVDPNAADEYLAFQGFFFV